MHRALLMLLLLAACEASPASRDDWQATKDYQDLLARRLERLERDGSTAEEREALRKDLRAVSAKVEDVKPSEVKETLETIGLVLVLAWAGLKGGPVAVIWMLGAMGRRRREEQVGRD